MTITGCRPARMHEAMAAAALAVPATRRAGHGTRTTSAPASTRVVNPAAGPTMSPST